MATVSESEIEEPPEEKQNNNNAAAVLALSSSPPAVPWPAAVAERYERREWLGKGMFGDVYKAWDRVLERDVAVKRLSGRTDERFVAAPGPYFEREVESLAACRGHPNVVQLLAAYATDGNYFVVTEYAGPINLRTYIRRRRRDGKPFDEDEVRDVMEQLLAGAAHAHAVGVLHRDIVPENVIADMDAATSRIVYKICGFGVSEPTVAQAEERDDCGPVASARPYRAPELVLGFKDYDDRVDTWSLGCIMAELIAGDPFSGTLPVVGTKGNLKWQRLEHVVPPTKVALGIQKGGHEGFQPQVLSTAGFKVLKGLLESNPDRRLSAVAALSKQWFRRRCLFSAWCFMPHGGIAP